MKNAAILFAFLLTTVPALAQSPARVPSYRPGNAATAAVQHQMRLRAHQMAMEQRGCVVVDGAWQCPEQAPHEPLEDVGR